MSGTMNNALPELISRVREYTDIPLAVGFGVATRQHFDLVADAGADGVVIGSRLVSIIKNAPASEVSKSVEAYCREISLKDQPQTRPRLSTATSSASHVSRASKANSDTVKQNLLPPRFGEFGGQYVPEALWDCLIELEEAHQSAMKDPAFWKEFESFYGYMNRPSKLYKAEQLTKQAGGATIWLKREDLWVPPLLCTSGVNRIMLGTTRVHTKSTTRWAKYALQRLISLTVTCLIDRRSYLQNG